MTAREDFPPIPRVMLEAAEAEDLSQLEIARAWRDFIRWHRKTLGDQAFRMSDWNRQIDFACRDKSAKEDLVELPSAPSAPLKGAALEKAIAEEIYLRGAVSFDGYLRGLCAAVAAGNALAEHDAAFLGWLEAHPKAKGLSGMWAFGQDEPCRCHGGAIPCNRQDRPRHKREPDETRRAKPTETPTPMPPLSSGVMRSAPAIIEHLTAEEIEERRAIQLAELAEWESEAPRV